MKNISQCPVCEGTENSRDNTASSFLNLTEDFSVRRCSRCSFRWLNPQPSEEEYMLVYSGAYFRSEDSQSEEMPSWLRDYPAPSENYSEMADKARRANFLAKLERIRSLAPDSQRVLDIGAGTGTFVSVAIEAGFDCAGIESSKEACEEAEQKYGIQLGQDTLSSFESEERFDVLHLSHVFEHLIDPRASLKKLSSLLKTDGLLVIEVPNQFDSALQRTLSAAGRLEKLQRSLHSIHHPYFYRPATLKRLLESQDFDCLKLSSYFPERWEGSAKRQLLRAVDYLGDKLCSAGREFEIIASKKSRVS